jgi:hypothetical protein
MLLHHLAEKKPFDPTTALVRVAVLVSMMALMTGVQPRSMALMLGVILWLAADPAPVESLVPLAALARNVRANLTPALLPDWMADSTSLLIPARIVDLLSSLTRGGMIGLPTPLMMESVIVVALHQTY